MHLPRFIRTWPHAGNMVSRNIFSDGHMSTIEHLTGEKIRVYRQIELMQEYRTRLISDVVTGKLDVREAA